MTERKPKKAQTAAQKRGLGKGHAAGLGMEGAYKPDVLQAQRKHACKNHKDDIIAPCPGPDVCACRCHETHKMVARFKL